MSHPEEMQIELPMIGAQKPRIYTQPVANYHTIYLTGELMEAGEYTEEFYILKTATPNDQIDIEINGVGGDLFTAIQFFNAIMSSEARVTTVLNGMAYSAHSVILLAGDSSIIKPNTSLMIHNGVGGNMGKIEDILKAAQHSSAMTRNLLENVYEGFLTTDEIQEAVKGIEFWMESDEVIERLNKRAKYFEAIEEAMQNEDCDPMKELYYQSIDNKLED